MAVFDDYSGVFSGQMVQQMQVMQQNQAMTTQILSNLSNQVNQLGSTALHAGVSKIAQPFVQDTNTFANRTMGFGSALYHAMLINPNRYSIEQQRQMALDVGTSGALWASSGLKWASDIGGAASSILGWGMSPLLGLGSMAMFPLASSYIGHSQKLMREHADMTGFFMKESYKFASPWSQLQPYNYGLGLQDAQQFSRSLIPMNQEIFMNSDEFNKIVKGLTSSGLMVGAGTDLQSFKKRITESVQFIRSAAQILDESHEEVINLMADFKKLGISNANFDVEAGRMKGIATLTGQSSRQVVGQLMQLTQGQTQGTAINPTNTYLKYNDLMAFFGETYANPRTPTDMKNLIQQNGGAAGAAGAVGGVMNNLFSGNLGFALGSLLFKTDKTSLTGFSYDSSEFKNLISSGMDLNQIAQLANKRLAGMSHAELSMLSERFPTLLNSLSPELQAESAKLYINGAQRISELRGMDQASIIQKFGKTDLASALLTAEFMNEVGSGDYLEKKGAREWTSYTMAVNTKAAGLKATLWEKFQFGLEGIKDALTSDVALGIQDSIVNKVDAQFNRFSTIRDNDANSATGYSPIGKGLNFSEAGAREFASKQQTSMSSLESRLINEAGKLREQGIFLDVSPGKLQSMSNDEKMKYLKKLGMHTQIYMDDLSPTQGQETKDALGSFAGVIGQIQEHVITDQDYTTAFNSSVQQGIKMLAHASTDPVTQKKLIRVNELLNGTLNQTSGDLFSMAYYSSNFNQNNPEEYRKSVKSQLTKDFKNINVDGRTIDEIVSQLRKQGVSGEQLKSIQSRGNEIKSDLARGLAAESSEKMVDFLMDIAQVVTNKADKTQNAAAKFKEDFSTVEKALESHAQAMDTVGKYINGEIDTLRNNFPNAGIPEATGPRSGFLSKLGIY